MFRAGPKSGRSCTTKDHPFQSALVRKPAPWNPAAPRVHQNHCRILDMTPVRTSLEKFQQVSLRPHALRGTCLCAKLPFLAGESCSQSRSHSLVSLGQASPSSTAHVNTSVRPATMSHTQQYVGDQGCCSTRLLNAAALSSHVDDEEHYEEVAGLDSVSAVETDDELFDDIDPQGFEQSLHFARC